MKEFTFHIDGWSAIDSVTVQAVDEQHAKNILLGAWLNGRPLVQEGFFKLLITTEIKENN